jgi:uroporphyrinogen decarboxylase
MTNETRFFEQAIERPLPKPPVWLMRQAGRYLPEYRAVREQAGDFVALCLNPELACEVTLQPIRRFGFDAAIIFSDILMIPYALGQKLWFETGEGPRLGAPDWHEFDAEKLQPVYDAIRLTRTNLPKEAALIGFAGAPWTLLMYTLQGKGGGEFQDARLKIYGNIDDARVKLSVLTKAVGDHLINQIDAGCDTVQIFDSWAGLCPTYLHKDFLFDPAKTIVQTVRTARPNAKIIAFPKGYAGPKGYIEHVKPDVLGCDQFMPWPIMNSLDVVAQGNLDPMALKAGGAALDKAVDGILTAMEGRRHIFNLGHGIDKDTPLAHVEHLVTRLRA